MSQPIATAIFDHLVRQEPATENTLPADTVFRARTRPISVQFLAHLSIRCRQRVLELIEAVFYSDKPNSSEAKAPALVETYARLLYIAPGSRNKYKLQYNLRTSEPTRFHTLLELLNFRLFRFIKYAC